MQLPEDKESLLGMFAGYVFGVLQHPKHQNKRPSNQLGYYALQQMLKVDQSMNQSKVAAGDGACAYANNNLLLLSIVCLILLTTAIYHYCSPCHANQPVTHQSLASEAVGRVQTAQGPANHSRQGPAASPCINTCSPSVGEQTCLHSLSV